MTEDEIEKHALRFSKSYQYDKSDGKRSSKWSDPDARPKMALKTVLKALLGTYGVMSADMQRAFESDTEHEQANNFRVSEGFAEFEEQVEPEVIDNASDGPQATIQL